jgi:hypothetical protein
MAGETLCCVPRMRRSAPRLAAWYAADPGTIVLVWVPVLRSGTTHRIASGTRDDGGKLIAGSEGGRDSIPLPSCPASCRASTSSVVLGIKTWITGTSPVTTGGWRHEGRSNCSSLDRFFTASGDLPVVPMCRSAAKLRASPNQRHRPRVPSRFTRGVSRSSRTSGAGCDGRFSVRQTSAPEKRTAKSCGPDAPTLASSCAERSAWRRWQ